MGYWDFLNVLQTMRDRVKQRKGEPIIRDKVPQSNKDMIQRLKDYGKDRKRSNTKE